MPTLMQKIRLAIRGWSRRREEAEKEFLAKNVWGPASAGPEAGRLKPASTQKPAVDTEGLAVAYLDDSGRIAYYLDTETGDVVDVRDGTALSAPRYRRVPARSEQTDAEDRRAFAESHETLAQSLGSAEEFRRALSGDRAVERAWYNFKNDRAIAAIEEWLRRL